MKPLGVFEHHQDVGEPKRAGNAVYNPLEQTYTLSGAGANQVPALDQFHFAEKRIQGDFIVQATLRLPTVPGQPRHTIGIMARDARSGSSRYAAACVHGTATTALQSVGTAGGTPARVELSSFHPTEIQFARTGNTFTLSAATFGENYKSVSQELALDAELHVGLFLCSGNEDELAQAVFSNVRVILPAAADFKPYSDYL